MLDAAQVIAEQSGPRCHQVWPRLMFKLQIVYHQYHVQWWGARGPAIAVEFFEKQHDVSIRGICSLRTTFRKRMSESCIPYSKNMWRTGIPPPFFGTYTNKLWRVVRDWLSLSQDYL